MTEEKKKNKKSPYSFYLSGDAVRNLNNRVEKKNRKPGSNASASSELESILLKLKP